MPKWHPLVSLLIGWQPILRCFRLSSSRSAWIPFVFRSPNRHTTCDMFHAMVSVCSHDGAGLPPNHGGTPRDLPLGGRLNLLISYGSWRHDSWADRLPCLLEPMGIHSVRARSAREAEKVIRTLPVHIAVVDMGLPLDEPSADSRTTTDGVRSANLTDAEEAGPRLLELLRRLDSPPPTVIVKSPRTHRDDCRHVSAALRCGAFAVVDRSAADLERMLDILRRCLARFYQDRWPESGDSPSQGQQGKQGIR